MQVATTVAALRAAIPQPAQRVGFVPTMGNLHAGHIDLVTKARQHCDVVVVSIFVNPTQFGVGEDFDSYPRTFDADCQALQKAGCDVVFAPEVAQIYPLMQPHLPAASMGFTTVSVTAITELLCGASRVGHFDGVATVVTKLLNVVRPTDLYMGEKDYQQLAVVRTLVQDLLLPITVHGVPTVRAPSGLALSSRNGYLTPSQLALAPSLYATLRRVVAQVCVCAQSRDYTPSQLQKVLDTAKQSLTNMGFVVDYLQLYTNSLQEPTINSTKLVVLVAAYIGKTRLIDNIAFSLSPANPSVG